MTCVAMGYPDDSFAANAAVSDREHNNDFVHYIGFDDDRRPAADTPMRATTS